MRQLNSVARHLDCDGLTTFVDPATERVQNMQYEYQRQIAELENRLALAKAQMAQFNFATTYNGAGQGPENIHMVRKWIYI